MEWSQVGDWLKSNAGAGASLVGSLLTGNITGAVAAGISLVGAATGTANAAEALQALQTDPATMVKLKELAVQDSENIRNHIRQIAELELRTKQVILDDAQKEQEQTQTTIRSGDNAEDPYVRKTRPLMARQSWYATMSYVVLFEGLNAYGTFHNGAVMELAMVLIAPAAAYMGFRTWDKSNAAKFATK